MSITLGKYGVRVNAVSPGPVKTDIFARARYSDELITLLDGWGEPEEIAEIVTSLASDKAKDMSFESKVYRAGIGAAIAIAFAKESANLVIVGRNEENLRKVAKQCEINNRIPYVINADVTNENDTKRIIHNTIKKFNKLDILVNNAGILRSDLSQDNKVIEKYDEIMKTNVRAVVDLTRLATQFLIQSKGNIVNISSVNGSRVFRGEYTLIII
ncbi:unnamed protein product [Leptidea sinapis]|uniref:Uncharacterized protein n=1 Tax=Leptidea sinapis TaxID=189913 RepID=A0A5E4QTX2_9NEOP|nr:unnamed protein product [Leptidea sinapis]